MKDTPPGVEAAYRALLAARTPAERLAMASDMFDFARECVLAGLRAEGVTGEEELRVQLFLRLHGRDFAPEARARIVARLRGGQTSA